MSDTDKLTLSDALKNAKGHFFTVTEHKLLVMKFCFKCGLYRQGILHDLSKYMPDEFIVGIKYWQGDRSPNDIDRRTNGYSSAWLHHKGRNKHHYEYWTDYLLDGNGGGAIGPVPMPKKYIAEMFCDRLSACHVYNSGNFSNNLPLDYYNRAKSRKRMTLMHPDTDRDLHFLLLYCSRYGEEKTLQYIKYVYLKS